MNLVKVENGLKYYEALDKAYIQNDYDDFIQLVAMEAKGLLDLYLSALQ